MRHHHQRPGLSAVRFLFPAPRVSVIATLTNTQPPSLVAHQLLSKVVDEFLSASPRSAWATGDHPSVSFPELKEYIVKYQDPAQADSIMKIQQQLDETKIVLHKTIESVLQRGEKIDDLVAKSDGLSAQSKMFYSECRMPSEQKGSPATREDKSNSRSPSKEAELVLRGDVRGRRLQITDYNSWTLLFLH